MATGLPPINHQINGSIAAALAAERAQVPENPAPQVAGDPEQGPRQQRRSDRPQADAHAEEPGLLAQMVAQGSVQVVEAGPPIARDDAPDLVLDLGLHLGLERQFQFALHQVQHEQDLARAERRFQEALALDGQAPSLAAQLEAVVQPMHAAQALPHELITPLGQEHAAREAPGNVHERAQQNTATEIGAGIAMRAGGAGSARQLRGPRQVADGVPRDVASHLRPAAPGNDSAVAFSRVINDWRARLLGFAERTQPGEVRATLRIESSRLLHQIRTNPSLAALCDEIASYAGGDETGALIALNEMHEAAMVARCEHPDIDARTLIGLGTDLFVLGLVKEAALASAAPARVAGNHDEAWAIMLARQSALCVKLGMFDFRAPLPTRNVDFNRMDEPTEGQMDRERELLQTLQDGTALRQHLASWPVLGLHVETAHADEFAQLWGQLQPLMADLQEYADSTKIGEGPYLTLANEVSAKIGEQAAVLRQGKVNEVLQSILDARQDQNNRLIAAALAAERAQVAENAAPQVPMAQAEAPDPWVIGAEPESEPEPAQARPEVEQILALAQRYGDEVRRLTQVLEQLRLQAEQTPASSYIDRAVVEDITRSLQMAQDAQQRLHEQAALAQARGVPGRGQPEAAQAEGGAQHVRDFIQALLGPQSGLTPAQVVGVLTQRGDEPGFSPLRQAAGMPQREGHAEGSGQAPEDVFERAQQIAAAESRGGIAMSGGGAGSARQLRAPRQVANAVPPNVAPHQQIVALDPFEGRQEPGLPGLNVALSRGHADGVRQLMQQIPQLGGATGMVHRDAPGVVPDPAAAADAVQMHVQHQPFMTHQRRDLPDSHEATEQRTQHENQGVAPAKNR